MVYSFSGFPPAENAFILSNLKCKCKRRTLKILSSISFVLGRFVEVGKNPAVKLVASAAMLLIHVHTHRQPWRDEKDTLYVGVPHGGWITTTWRQGSQVEAFL